MIKVKNIIYSYGKKRVLDGVCLTAAQGDCVAVAGANGCGKSTLLSLLAGALRPQAGEMIYGGRDAAKEKNVFQKMVGYVPQDNPLFEELTVRDNLRLWYSESPYSMEKDLSSGILSVLKLSEMLSLRVSRLSGGMKKRVSIGCALAAHPPILILDEPSAALDLICKEDIRRYLTMYLKQKGTILITTHEEAELDLCNRLYILKKGKLAERDPKLRGAALLQELA
ncbi:ABC transporter ATP-binding protein [Cuneatibacter sp. NSJ-177]|uniref:ABC transporter ATP-binding protein n=1 Tax=Cuneatibacter sp. NSJ-177 TaxID=2931401 RepID=UPI001FD62740|nr:ABC transporter ATP-binding protein [Cuneatibacter sp. NSJ-177]MCJ7835324.1 ABC transporter ATP-binding protein [Cuneatibacter sp. NSJ-177]